MNYYNEIKNELISNEIYKKVKDYSKNKNDLETYYKVGKLLFDAGKHYGEGIIKEYSNRLTTELGKGYTFTSLTRMKKYYILSKVATVSQVLTWSHYVEVLSIKNINEIEYYLNIAGKENLSVRELRTRIKLKEYERLDENTRLKLIRKAETNVSDFIKNPIILSNPNNYEENKEYALKQIILDDIPAFLEQLGEGFSFIKDEYKIKLGNNYNFIDLLLFNYIYNCFVVVELKITKLKKEHIGQIKLYMNYIDENIRKINQDKTIGIIICKEDDKYVIKYCSDDRIYQTKYILDNKEKDYVL